MPHDERSAAEQHYSHLSAMKAYEQMKDADTDWTTFSPEAKEMLRKWGKERTCYNCGKSIAEQIKAGREVCWGRYRFCSPSCMESFHTGQQARLGKAWPRP